MRARVAAAVTALALYQNPTPMARPPAPIYSDDPGDAWNRIFSLLFTRTIRATRLGESGTVETYEVGDRAIEALYPSFITRRGTDYAVAAPAQPALVAALTNALDERSPRAPLDRALMQMDLWSAFDALAPVAAAQPLLPLMGRLIGKLALTPEEISSLPDNFAEARTSFGLPDLFAPNGGWIEVVMAEHRMHDDAADFRRASRVFVRPLTPPADEALFLRNLPTATPSKLGAAVLVMQTLVIDSRGRVAPTHLISDMQMRAITREGRRGSSAFGDAPVDEYELSRRKLRSREAGGGFVHFGATSPAYVPLAGNDYGFATPARDRQGETAPVLTTLRTRCAACHGTDGSAFMTFNLITGPGQSLPPVVRLRQPNDDRARYVAMRKEEREDFRRLIAIAFPARAAAPRLPASVSAR